MGLRSLERPGDRVEDGVIASRRSGPGVPTTAGARDARSSGSLRVRPSGPPGPSTRRPAARRPGRAGPRGSRQDLAHDRPELLTQSREPLAGDLAGLDPARECRQGVPGRRSPTRVVPVDHEPEQIGRVFGSASGRASRRSKARGRIPDRWADSFASALEASRTNEPPCSSSSGWRFCQTIVRDELVLAAGGRARRPARAGLHPFDLPGGDGDLELNVRRRVAGQRDHLRAHRGIDPVPRSRRHGRPRRGSRGRRAPAAALEVGRQRPAPTSAQSACIRAFRGAVSSRTSACSFSRARRVFRSVRSRWARSRK